MTTPTFSIIVPIYKIENYLEQCIRSVLEQSFQNYELILVDDGSPDRCGEIADSFAALDERILVIHKQNEGLFRARNSGLAVARGEYIVNVDGDDSLLPDALETLYCHMQKHHADVYCFGFLAQSTEDCQAVLPRYLEGLYEGERKEALYASMIYDEKSPFFTYGLYPSVWSRVVRRSLFTEVRFKVDYDFSIGEDFATTLPVMLAADTISILAKPLYCYRVLPSSMSHGFHVREMQHVAMLLHWFERCGYFDIRQFRLQEQLGAYTIDVLYNHLVAFSRRMGGYSALTDYIKKLDPILLRYTQYGGYNLKTVKGAVVTIAVKHRLWRILRLLARRNGNAQ